VAIRRRSPGRALGTGGTINWGIFKRHFWGELLRHQHGDDVTLTGNARHLLGHLAEHSADEMSVRHGRMWMQVIA
jgi:hypothetical protein